MRRGRIVQVLPTMSYGDAVSNHALQIREVCKRNKWKTAIYAENIDPRVNHVSKVKNLSKDVSRHDLIIYHMSTGSSVTELVASLRVDKKVLIYHNITPAKYFIQYNKNLADLVAQGRVQLENVSAAFQLALGVSEFNRAELETIGFRNTGILPLWFFGNKYEGQPDSGVMKAYQDGKTNILFVGRIAPNKKHEDLIKAFYYYKRIYKPSTRLLLVGSWNGMEGYFHHLQRYVKQLELDEDVVFTGHVSDGELLAYYRVAHIFLSMSEHEGFCVPLLESMHFEVPILAFSAAAIPDTLGDAGLVFKQKDYPAIAALLDVIDRHPDISRKLIESQRERLKDYDESLITNKFWQYINSL